MWSYLAIVCFRIGRHTHTGVPIPFANLGNILPEMIPSLGGEESALDNLLYLVELQLINSFQVTWEDALFAVVANSLEKAKESGNEQQYPAIPTTNTKHPQTTTAPVAALAVNNGRAGTATEEK